MQVGETLTLAFLMQRALVRDGPTRLLRFQATYLFFGLISGNHSQEPLKIVGFLFFTKASWSSP